MLSLQNLLYSLITVAELHLSCQICQHHFIFESSQHFVDILCVEDVTEIDSENCSLYESTKISQDNHLLVICEDFAIVLSKKHSVDVLFYILKLHYASHC